MIIVNREAIDLDRFVRFELVYPDKLRMTALGLEQIVLQGENAALVWKHLEETCPRLVSVDGGVQLRYPRRDMDEFNALMTTLELDRLSEEHGVDYRSWSEMALEATETFGFPEDG